MTDSAIVRWVMDTFEGHLYTDHPVDTGGATRHGITLRTLQYYRRAVTGNPSLIVTKQDVKDLSVDEAVACGLRVFMAEPRIDRIADWKTKLMVYDYCFHSGPFMAVSALQESMGFVNVDGVLGPITLEHATLFSPQLLLGLRVLTRRELFMQRIIQKKQTQRTWMLGWWRRTTQLQEQLAA